MTAKHDVEFSFVILLPCVSELTVELEDALFEAGCDDALLGLQNGLVTLDFDRAAVSRDAAVASALADVRSAGYAAELLSPTLAGA